MTSKIQNSLCKELITLLMYKIYYAPWNFNREDVFISFPLNARIEVPNKNITMNSREIWKLELEAMDFDELWLLHEQLTQILSGKISAEKLELEKRLAQLHGAEPIAKTKDSFAEKHTDRPPRRKYPKVQPKYCNPSAPEETWSGRGKQPRWLVTALQSGHRLEEFRISELEQPSDEADHGQS